MVDVRNRSNAKMCGWIDLTLLILYIIGSLIVAIFIAPIQAMLENQGFLNAIVKLEESDRQATQRDHYNGGFGWQRNSERNHYRENDDTNKQDALEDAANTAINEASGVIKTIWISTLIDIAVAGVQLVAAILLINSTSLERSVESALKLAMFWMILNVVVFVAYFIWRMIVGYWLMLVISPIIRGCLIAFVGLYIQELRRVTTTSSAQDQIGSTNLGVSVIRTDCGSNASVPPYTATPTAPPPYSAATMNHKM